tara:strand:- start:676 stop:1290 length:615 start_codon:yes stop_codon:yes gene_type:complete
MGKDKKNKKQTYASVRERPWNKYVVGSGGIIETKLFRDFVFDEYTNKNSWLGIENYAKANGVYTSAELRKLIKANSPIKSIGDANMELAKIVYNDQLKNPDKTFHAICVDNMEKLCVLVGQDPFKVSMGENWFRLQRNKNIKIKRADFKLYTLMIKLFEGRYKRVMNKQKAFLTWYAQNKNNKDFLQFLYKTLKYLKSKNKKLK